MVFKMVLVHLTRTTKKKKKTQKKGLLPAMHLTLSSVTMRVYVLLSSLLHEHRLSEMLQNASVSPKQSNFDEHANIRAVAGGRRRIDA